MKLRIRDSSFRFRITLKELEELDRSGRLLVEARVGPGEPALVYGISVDRTGGESRLELSSGQIILWLSVDDLVNLGSADREGVYLRREWMDSQAGRQRSLVFVEKDRPAVSCDKPELWIYDDHPGKEGGAGS